MRHAAKYALLLLLAVACGPGRVAPKSAPVNQYLILAAELESSGQDNVHDAVRRLRPFWLTRTVRNRVGDEAVAIYVEERFLGTLSVLRTIPVSSVERVRYLSPSEATTQLGRTPGGRAVIMVDSARP